MDIKLDNISLKNGGLHVIIPYYMENNRVYVLEDVEDKDNLVLLLFMLVMMIFIMKLKILTKNLKIY